MRPCAASRIKASAPPSTSIGEIGVMMIEEVCEPVLDVYGEVTNVKYPFTQRNPRYVDTRDAVFLLGQDFVLG